MSRKECAMVRKNEYLEQLLDEIDRLRKSSLSNMKKTDLYTKDDIWKIINWYDQLVLACKMTPPASWVDSLIIKEDGNGHVRIIEYEYSTKKCSIIVMAE